MSLQIKHITKSFGAHKVLIDVSFILNAGTVSVLMGTNGSGKTTLFNIISRFLTQDKGEVWIGGINLMRLPSYKINCLGIARTFQDMRLIENLSVKENVQLAFANQKGEKWWRNILPNKTVKQEQQDNAEKTNAILKMCFIDDVAENKASEISYGQQKLLNLACCIANDAKVLLLDEPVAGVNPMYRERLAKLIIQLKEQDKTILIIEHNADFIEAVADKILFLHNGRIQEFKDYKTLRESASVKNAFV